MSNPMILVVEDDSTVQNLIVTALETQADLLSLPAGGEYTNCWSITIT